MNGKERNGEEWRGLERIGPHGIIPMLKKERTGGERIGTDWSGMDRRGPHGIIPMLK